MTSNAPECPRRQASTSARSSSDSNVSAVADGASSRAKPTSPLVANVPSGRRTVPEIEPVEELVKLTESGADPLVGVPEKSDTGAGGLTVM